MPPAARRTDKHVCKLPPPHGPNIITAPCEPTVQIGGLDAARVSDVATCGSPISKGSLTVKIGNLNAARLGDPTSHPGEVIQGEPTVIIGDVGMGDCNCMSSASDSGSALVSGGPSPGGDMEDSGF